MEVYLDNAATTRPRKEVVAAVVYAMEENYGNPSSLHKKGLAIEREIKAVRKKIGSLLGCLDKELFFTSGGTESNNLAIRGMAAAYHRRGKHLITTQVEHPSVLKTMEALEQEGFRVTYLPVDQAGFVDPEAVEQAVSDETILVSIMEVNNEVGCIQPISEIGRLIKRKKPEVRFHVDAIQSFGKHLISLAQSRIDTLAFSGHKLHGPKGIGGLYVSKGTRLNPVFTGGNQETGLRSGTENTPGILGLGKAVELMWHQQQEKIRRMAEGRAHLAKGLQDQIQDVVLFWEAGRSYAPHILAVAFPGVKSEVLLHSLEEDGIYVSSGSACSSRKKGHSHVLMAMKVQEALIDSTLRFSLSDETTREELDYTIEKCRLHVQALRKIMR